MSAPFAIPALAVRPFEAADWSAIERQPAQAIGLTGADGAAMAEALAQAGGFTAFERRSGRILFIGGVAQVHAHYGSAWAMLALGKGALMVTLTRRVRAYLDSLPYARIDCMVSATFESGLAWMAALGFAQEGLHRALGPEGGDMFTYARIRD